MPELPEVEITRLKLAPFLRGRRVLGFWTDWPRGLKAENGKKKKEDSRKWVAGDIRGRKVLDVTRRGKVLFFKLSPRRSSGRAWAPERIMAIHLRMSGRLAVAPMDVHRWDKSERSFRFVPADATPRWVHFIWRLSGGRELHFIDPRKFGRVWYGGPGELAGDPYLGSLGVDAKVLSPRAFTAALLGRRGMVKPLLLRQDIVAGIGNIIADESLWRAGIHPRASVSSLDGRALHRLHGALRETIRAILASGGTSMRNFRHPDGQPGRYQERRLAYGRAGAPCRRCHIELERIVVGGRGTTICPKCQRL